MQQGDARPHELTTLPHQVIEAVGGWTTGTTPRLPGPLREVLVRELTHMLVGTARREAYLDLLQVARAELVRGKRFDASRPSAELPVGGGAASGLDRLDDVALVDLALDPLHLEATAELIDCLAESGELGREWWDAMAHAGEKAYPWVSGADRLVRNTRGNEYVPSPDRRGLSPDAGLED